MRCREARRRLTEYQSIRSEIAEDYELLDHLKECPACAAQARAASELQQAFATAYKSDNTDNIPWLQQVARVEDQVALNNREKSKGITIMSTITNQLKRRPKFSIGMATVTVVLAISLLVPFTFDRTIGYEVALAGVDKNLAMDNDKINQLLQALGMEDFTIDVGDCETTCRLKISDLQTEGDAQLVVAAFDEIGNCKLEGIRPILEGETASLAKYAAHVINLKSELKDGEEVHEIVIKCLSELDSDSCGTFDIWITQDSGLEEIHEVVVMTGCSDTLPGSLNCWVGTSPDQNKLTSVEMVQSPNGSTELKITTPDGEVEQLDLSQEDAIARLRELGLDINITGDEDGKMIMCTQTVTKDGESVNPDDVVAKAAEDSELPEGFMLSENYPNPFNPTTQIDYTVPHAQHVTLDVFNINGQKVKTLVDDMISAGQHTVEWNATSDVGDRVASGVYLYRLTAGDAIQTKKMTLLK